MKHTSETEYYHEFRIPNCVKSLESNCFVGFKFAESVYFPTSITSIHSSCFENCCIHSIHIPSTIKYIEKDCFENILDLTSITIPINKTRIIVCNKIYKIPHFEQEFYLPSTIKQINNQTVYSSVMKIPSTVTSIDEG